VHKIEIRTIQEVGKITCGNCRLYYKPIHGSYYCMVYNELLLTTNTGRVRRSPTCIQKQIDIALAQAQDKENYKPIKE